MNDLKTMYEYLGYAFRMEQNVYTLEQSLAKTLAEKNNTTAQLSNLKNSYDENVFYLENNSVDTAKKEAISEEKAKMKKFLKWIIVYILAIVFFVTLLSIGISTDNMIFSIAMFPLGILVPLAPFLFYFFIWRVYTRTTSGKASAGHTARQLIQAKNNVTALVPKIENCESYISSCDNYIVGLQKNLNEARQQRDKLYSKNYLPDKYRNLFAVGMMYGYIRDRRCTVVDGFGGIYYTFEEDVKHRETNRNLSIIIEQNREIIANQEIMISALNSINSNVTRIHTELKDFHKDYMSCEAARRVYESQMAENVSYMRWEMSH